MVFLYNTLSMICFGCLYTEREERVISEPRDRVIVVGGWVVRGLTHVVARAWGGSIPRPINGPTLMRPDSDSDSDFVLDLSMTGAEGAVGGEEATGGPSGVKGPLGVPLGVRGPLVWILDFLG